MEQPQDSSNGRPEAPSKGRASKKKKISHNSPNLDIGMHMISSESAGSIIEPSMDGEIPSDSTENANHHYHHISQEYGKLQDSNSSPKSDGYEGQTVVDGVVYNNRGYEVCGQLNQHNKPCQRIGKCPFHNKKPSVPAESNPSEKKSKPPVKRAPYKQGWTKDEHLRFLNGLQIHGKGAWKEIALIVGTRTATQIQSHAQKYYLRQKQTMKNKKSIHDVTLEECQDLDSSLRGSPVAKPIQLGNPARPIPFAYHLGPQGFPAQLAPGPEQMALVYPPYFRGEPFGMPPRPFPGHPPQSFPLPFIANPNPHSLPPPSHLSPWIGPSLAPQFHDPLTQMPTHMAMSSMPILGKTSKHQEEDKDIQEIFTERGKIRSENSKDTATDESSLESSGYFESED